MTLSTEINKLSLSERVGVSYSVATRQDPCGHSSCARLDGANVSVVPFASTAVATPSKDSPMTISLVALAMTSSAAEREVTGWKAVTVLMR